MDKVALNQSYKKEKTFEEYPEIEETYNNYVKYCLEEVKWHKYGRAYDCSIALHQVDFKDKIVCELGARDSIFSSYLTKYVKEVYASDTFEGWGDLGDICYWDELWKKYAFDKSKHITQFQDMKKLSYQDNFMDVVISFSAIEHIPGEGDILAAKEMHRVCKPGGHIILGTDMCSSHKWASGGFFYDENSFFERIIKCFKDCNFVGRYDFDFEKSDRHLFDNFEYTSLICVLKKEI